MNLLFKFGIGHKSLVTRGNHLLILASRCRIEHLLAVVIDWFVVVFAASIIPSAGTTLNILITDIFVCPYVLHFALVKQLADIVDGEVQLGIVENHLLAWVAPMRTVINICLIYFFVLLHPSSRKEVHVVLRWPINHVLVLPAVVRWSLRVMVFVPNCSFATPLGWSYNFVHGLLIVAFVSFVGVGSTFFRF